MRMLILLALILVPAELRASQAITEPTLRLTLDSPFLQYRTAEPPLDNLWLNVITNVFRPTHLLDVFFLPMPSLEYRMTKRTYFGLEAGLVNWGGGSAGGDYFVVGLFKGGLKVTRTIPMDPKKESWLSLGGGVQLDVRDGRDRTAQYLEVRGGMNYRVAAQASFGPYLSASVFKDSPETAHAFGVSPYRTEFAIGLHSTVDLLP